MNEFERSSLAGIRDCWMAGGAAFDFAPDGWKQIAGQVGPEERERLLLAIVAQAFDVGLRPAAPKSLLRREPLPSLALPTVPETLRPLFRTALKNAANRHHRTRLLGLVASRGFVAHPLDWMPAASDTDAPGVYAPWVDWRINDGTSKKNAGERLSADNWHEFYPAARRVILSDLRRSDPAAALALIEAKAGSEAAEARLPIIEILRVKLNADDVPYLKSLANDRSSKVRELASRLLARLGQRDGRASVEAVDLASELASFVEQAKAGFIRRRITYAPAKLKSNAQQNRRREVFEASTFADLVARFGVSEAEFIEGWQFEADKSADQLLVEMVAASGSDAAVEQLADVLAAGSAELAQRTVALLPRLDNRRKRAFVQQVLSSDARHLTVLNVAEELELGWLGPEDLRKHNVPKMLRSAFGSSNDELRRFAAQLLLTLGPLVSAPAAQVLIDESVAGRLPPADPVLALLRLNAALQPQR